jgi:uncharacterized protein (DUF433 family)
MIGGFMGAVQKSLRIPQETVKEIEQLASESGSDFSSIAKDLLEEAIKTRHCPGIIFAEGVTGRRARVAGTGLEVWEVIATYRGVNQNFKRLKKAFHWLTEQQLRAAIGYYNVYRDEIDLQIKRNASWSKEALFKRYPFLSKEHS